MKIIITITTISSFSLFEKQPTYGTWEVISFASFFFFFDYWQWTVPFDMEQKRRWERGNDTHCVCVSPSLYCPMCCVDKLGGNEIQLRREAQWETGKRKRRQVRTRKLIELLGQWDVTRTLPIVIERTEKQKKKREFCFSFSKTALASFGSSLIDQRRNALYDLSNPWLKATPTSLRHWVVPLKAELH